MYDTSVVSVHDAHPRALPGHSRQTSGRLSNAELNHDFPQSIHHRRRRCVCRDAGSMRRRRRRYLAIGSDATATAAATSVPPPPSLPPPSLPPPPPPPDPPPIGTPPAATSAALFSVDEYGIARGWIQPPGAQIKLIVDDNTQSNTTIATSGADGSFVARLRVQGGNHHVFGLLLPQRAGDGSRTEDIRFTRTNTQQPMPAKPKAAPGTRGEVHEGRWTRNRS